MKVLLSSLLIGLVACPLGLAAQGSNGCSAWLVNAPYACGNSNGCKGSGTTQLPGGGYGAGLTNTPIPCCGSWVPYYQLNGGICYLTELRKPATQERLAQLASTSDMLVADCHGRYVLYRPHTGSERNENAILGKHMLD
jgi:hypothetical protein